MIRRPVAVLILCVVLPAVGLLGLDALPAAAQATCRQVTITSTVTSSGFARTPLDAIAFPVIPTPGALLTARQITVCPSVVVPQTVLPSVTPVVFPAPVFQAPAVFPVPTGTIFGVPSVFSDPPAAPSPSGLMPPAASSRPAGPAVVGRASHETVADLAGRSGDYDRQMVSVTGTVKAVKPAVAAGDHRVTVFELASGSAAVRCLVWGSLPLRPGAHVRVTGTFYTTTPYTGPSGAPWHNVIEAEVVRRS